MAMTNEQLMIELGLDATKVTKSISQLKNQLKGLENQRALTKTEADLEIVNRKIALVKGELGRLQNFGFDDLQKSSKGARTAVTNLSIAIQDLPFGFIGIQNNLPGVIQGFGNLSSESKNLGEFFKNLVGQLKGPAGIFLAFSLVTSVVTVLVQKYGSLSNAIDSLLGRQNALNNQISKFNKDYADYLKTQRLSIQVTNDATASQEGQIQVLQLLTKQATDLTASAESQKNALDELKRINKDYYDGLKIGKGNVDDIKTATEQYIKVLIAKARVQQYVNKIDDIEQQIKEADRLAKQQQILVDAERKTNNEKKRSAGTSSDISAQIINEINSQDANRAALDKLYESLFKLNNDKQTYIDLANEELKIVGANTKETEKATKALKKYFDEYKPPRAYLEFIDFFSNENVFARGKEAFNDLNRIDLSNGAQALLDFNEIFKKLKEDIPLDFSEFEKPTLQTLPGYIEKIRALLKTELDYLALDIAEADIFQQFNKIAIEGFEELKKKFKKSVGKIFVEIPLDTSNVFGKGPGTYEQVMAPLIKRQEEMKKEAQKFVQNLRDTASLIGDVFFNPLQDQFTKLLETGKFSFKEFGRAVLDNMKQLAAKLLATGIITLLATIATGGFSAATQAKTGLTGFQAFGKAFAGALGFGGLQRGPNLANIGAGGLAMSGAVNLTLRGSDLVGALNRTNTNINRIG